MREITAALETINENILHGTKNCFPINIIKPFHNSLFLNLTWFSSENLASPHDTVIIMLFFFLLLLFFCSSSPPPLYCPLTTASPFLLVLLYPSFLPLLPSLPLFFPSSSLLLFENHITFEWHTRGQDT